MSATRSDVIIDRFVRKVNERLAGVQPYSLITLDDVYEPEELNRILDTRRYCTDFVGRGIMIGLCKKNWEYSIFYIGVREDMESVVYHLVPPTM